MDHKQNRKAYPYKSLLAVLTAGVLVVNIAVALLPQQVHAEKSDLSVRNWHSSSKAQVPELKPSWTAQVDNYLAMNDPYVGRQAVAGEGKVFSFAGSKLIALDAATGKRIWTYGQELTPYVVYHNGFVYGLTGDHQPYVVNAKTGKERWRSSSSTWIDTRLRSEVLLPIGDTLYVIKGSRTFAFDLATGKLRWTADEPLADGHGTEYLEEVDGVVLRTFYIQGALTSVQLNAYDKKTGEKLWGHFGQGEALLVKDGLVYSVDDYSPLHVDYQSMPERDLIINAFNLKTGVKKGTRTYSWSMPGEPPYEWGQGQAFLSNGKLYIEQGNEVAEYDFNVYKAGIAPLRMLQRPYGNDWGLVQTIVQNRLIYRNAATGELAGIKLANGQNVGWYGDAPAAQIDVYGKGMYRAQRNGTLLGINALTTEIIFRVSTGADLHEATLKTGNMIIIQAEGKLLGVKIPAKLQ